MNKRSIKLHTVVVILFAVATTLYTFWGLIVNPDGFLINKTGDAAKNYFTFLYHSLYSSGVWFDGMNYPYSEHLVYTDAQPAISIPLAFLSKYFSVQPLAIFHLLLVLSFFLAIIYVTKIFLRFEVHYLLAAFFASLIVLMSPQQLKLVEHFSLAYYCVLPILFYYTLLWFQTNNRGGLYTLFLCVLLFSFIHPYYTLMVCLWCVFYSGGYFVFSKEKVLRKLKHLYPYWMSCLVPVVLLLLFVYLTDSVSDRPSYPYGTRAHVTKLNDVFTSYLSPIWKWLASNNDTIIVAQITEGYSYIGVPATLIIIGVCFYIIVNLFKGKKVLTSTNNKSIALWLFVGLGMLFFASGVVFIFCFECLDNASIIKQFRAIGRFSWSFYYIVTIVTVVVLYRFYRMMQQRGRKLTAGFVVFLIGVIWFTEAFSYAREIKKLIDRGRQDFTVERNDGKDSWQSFIVEKGYDKNDFQCMLTLPYVHIGTEKLGVNTGATYPLSKAFDASLLLGVPIMDVMMSRSSWQQAFNQVKIEGGKLVEKTVLKEINNKPILLLHDKNYELNNDVGYILDLSQKLGTHDGLDVYIFQPKSLLTHDSVYRDSIAQYFDSVALGDTCIGTFGTYYVEHFDNGSYKEGFLGYAFGSIKSDKKTIFDKPISPLYDMQAYEFSIWTLVSKDNYKTPIFRICTYDEHDEKLQDITIKAQEAVDNKGLWLRVSMYFTMSKNCSRLTVELINIPNPAYIAIDELLLRPADALIITKTPEETQGMVNNHVFK